MESMDQGRRSRRSFTEQYKAEVVALCRGSEKSMSEIARALDLTESSVRRWVSQAGRWIRGIVATLSRFVMLSHPRGPVPGCATPAVCAADG